MFKPAIRFLALTAVLSTAFWFTWGNSLSYYDNSIYPEEISTGAQLVLTIFTAAAASLILVGALRFIMWVGRK